MAAGNALAAVGYIAAPGGLLLQASGDDAVLAAWNRQSPIQGFSGYGRIHLEGRCLTARAEGAPLRWEGCRLGDKAQVWKLIGDRLSNELEHCAEVLASGRVQAQACNGETGQRWKGLQTEGAEDVARGIADPLVRRMFLRTVAAAPAGGLVSLTTGLPVQFVVAGALDGVVVHLGGGTVVRLAARG
ncbi:RICIN domain-containing protein [Ramlibacter sp. XY19]|uniref:RICIN domain-containing protein n=1 Tax=Ramlibacter paludis TaxID=2908000 RepID=UPI0023DAB37A|nr:RICIN domain-containing protein [Ramlibacter paludis]MCG2593543.1 RICIN domain-containing protein [Ramlibacter paludis]